MIVGCPISSRLNADLANTMPDQITADLPDGCHLDRAFGQRRLSLPMLQMDWENEPGCFYALDVKKRLFPYNAACEGCFGRPKPNYFISELRKSFLLKISIWNLIAISVGTIKNVSSSHWSGWVWWSIEIFLVFQHRGSRLYPYPLLSRKNPLILSVAISSKSIRW